MFTSLAASPALQLATFSDVDAFRPVELVDNAISIPLRVADFWTARAVVRLPACRIILMRSFARILDAAYRAPGGMLIISMDDDVRARVKGADLDSRFVIALRGSADCSFVEPRSNLHALILLSPDLDDRGWVDHSDKIEAFAAERRALLHVRQLIFSILKTASAEPALFEIADLAAHLQEGLLLALDELFERDLALDASRPLISGDRALRLVRLLDDHVAAHPATAIYSADLAREFGVSIRTLSSAVRSVRGVSLHHYIRLKKLWSIRGRLLRGDAGTIVASCARAQGFHHMGEFAAMYRAAFNEPPSMTLARGRERDHGH